MSKTMRRNAYELMSSEELEREIATLERQMDDNTLGIFLFFIFIFFVLLFFACLSPYD